MDFLGKLGATSFVITILALYLLGSKNALAHIVFLFSYGIQIYIFHKTKQWFLIAQMGVLFIFSIVNYFRWTIGG